MEFDPNAYLVGKSSVLGYTNVMYQAKNRNGDSVIVDIKYYDEKCANATVIHESRDRVAVEAHMHYGKNVAEINSIIHDALIGFHMSV